MANNPIPYKALISPDDSISNLIRLLDETNDAYLNLSKNIKTEALQISASLRKVSGATEVGRDAIRKATEEAERLRAINKELAAGNNRLTQEIERLKAAQAEANKAMTEAVNAGNRQVQTNKVEAKSYAELKDAIDKQSGSIEVNAKKLRGYKDAISAIKKDIKGYYKEIDKARKERDKYNNGLDEYNEYNQEVERLQGKIEKLILAREELKSSQSQYTQNLKNAIKIEQAAAGSMDAMSQELGRMRMLYRAISKEERDGAFGEELLSAIQKTDTELKALDASIGNHQRNVGNYSGALENAFGGFEEKIKEALHLNNAFGESLIALGKGGTDGATAMSALKTNTTAFLNTLKMLASNPVFLTIAGVAGAGMAFKFWFDYNKGLMEATRLTQQFTGKEGDSLKAYRNQVQAVADAFNVDFKETLISVNAVAQQFGISYDEALKMIQDGFVAGGNASGRFLDTLKEYPAYFSEAGITAEQFIAIIAQTEKMGVFSDKGVDAIKEANLRLREMTTATAEALDGIGISSVQVQKDLQTGAKTTFDVMQEISARLAELPDNAASVGTAIADIFGGPGEDAGLRYLRTLKDISTNLDEVKGETGVLGQLQEEQLQSQIELQNALSGLFDMTGGNFETMSGNIRIFINDGLVLLIKYLIRVINYWREWYNESVKARVAVEGIIFLVKTLGQLIVNVGKTTLNVIALCSKAMLKLFNRDFSGAFNAVREAWKTIGSGVTDIVSTAISDAKKGIDNFNKKVPPITIPVNVGDTPKQPTTTNRPVTTNRPKTTTMNDGGKSTGNQQAKAVEEAYKKNLAATRKYQDAMLALEKDEWEKRRKQTIYQYARQIEDLRHQLEMDKTLNVQGVAAINATIQALEKKQTEALLDIERDQQMRELEVMRDTLNLRLSMVEKGSAEELRLRMALLDNEQQSALLANSAKPESERQTTADITGAFSAKKNNVAGEYVSLDDLGQSQEQRRLAELQAEREFIDELLAMNADGQIQFTGQEIAQLDERAAVIGKEMQDILAKNANEVLDSALSMLDGISIDFTNPIDATQKMSEAFLNLKDAFNSGDLKDQIQAVTATLNIMTEALMAGANAEVELANRAVEAADKQVEAAQKALDAEMEARANGYANNAEDAQRELELAKKTQEKALKDQKKAQKQQEKIQTLQQITNLVGATALIWSQLGFPSAIPAVAIMWASFAAAKVKAAQLAKADSGDSESYGDGTVELLNGGSHQSGNDIDLGRKPDGTRRRAEGGEFFAVINKRGSRRYRRLIPDVINSLNAGTFANKYLNAYEGGRNVDINVNNSADLRDLGKDVREIRNQNMRRMYVDGNGMTIEIYKNLTRRRKR